MIKYKKEFRKTLLNKFIDIKNTISFNRMYNDEIIKATNLCCKDKISNIQLLLETNYFK